MTKKKSDSARSHNKGLIKVISERAMGLSADLRAHVVREVARAKREKQQLSLITLEVDDLTRYKSTNGDLARDRMLETIGHLMRKTLRESDTVARFPKGDEFILLLPDAAKENAGRLADLIRLEVENHLFEGRKKQPPGSLTVSMSVATFPKDGKDAATLIQNAFIALYEAKEGGGNTVVLAGQGAFPRAA